MYIWTGNTLWPIPGLFDKFYQSKNTIFKTLAQNPQFIFSECIWILNRFKKRNLEIKKIKDSTKQNKIHLSPQNSRKCKCEYFLLWTSPSRALTAPHSEEWSTTCWRCAWGGKDASPRPAGTSTLPWWSPGRAGTRGTRPWHLPTSAVWHLTWALPVWRNAFWSG